MQRSLVEVHLYVVLVLRIFDIPIYVHHTGSLLENLLYLCRQSRLTFVVWPIHLSNESLQHRRTRWNLGDFDARA